MNEKSIGNKAMRVVYRINRYFYVSFVFYFLPWVVFVIYNNLQGGVFDVQSETKFYDRKFETE